ncbi:hypothetical protein ACRYCC_37555 [Actinomadura scrupuli]|uniref:hypothetical protein n=1 Tax=Actinomadura scrupuli TaxID=559629 RepID=UPI003D993118
MSEQRTSLGTRLFGGGIIVSELAVQQVGFGITSTLPALAVALVVTVAGSVLLAAYVGWRFGMGMRQFDRVMWKLVARVAASNTLIGIAYVLAVQKLGLGPVAAIGAIGVLSVGLTEILRSLGLDQPSPVQIWGYKQLGVRVIALLAVLVMTHPWTGEFDLVGLGWAVAAAWCFWNYVVIVFGPMAARDQVKQGTAVANLLSIPATMLVVWPFGAWGELFTEFSPVNWGFAVLAGLLVITVPALMQDWAGGKVSARTTGVLYCLDTPIAALIGTVGALLFLLDEVQRPSIVQWVAIGLIMIASLLVVLMGEKPTSPEAQGVQS